MPRMVPRSLLTPRSLTTPVLRTIREYVKLRGCETCHNRLFAAPMAEHALPERRVVQANVNMAAIVSEWHMQLSVYRNPLADTAILIGTRLADRKGSIRRKKARGSSAPKDSEITVRIANDPSIVRFEESAR